jgi:hypothetical protein
MRKTIMMVSEVIHKYRAGRNVAATSLRWFKNLVVSFSF